jgi:filamentous hemagglutinin family protein
MKTPTILFAPLALTSFLLGANVAHAQTYQPSNRIPVADSTLGTKVLGNSNFNITGGLQKGQTLFHSFSDFSVPTSGQANFFNPTGNRDIITRVTGGLFSDINGTISTQGANFFLINPNGLVFGPNAQLNVGKAFVGSTANGIDLVDGGGRTITFGANPNGDAPLLSVNPNVFFNVSRLNMGGGTGAISNFGTLQTPNNSQYIGLIGGNVTLDGSQGGGKIIAPGGRVDIGGLKSDGTITVGNNGMVFGGSGIRSDVSMINGAGITVRATGTLDNVNTFFSNVTAPGSSINISANNLDILNSGAKMNNQTAALDAGLELNSGVQTKAAGDINIDTIGKFNLNNSDIRNTLRTGAEGRIGDINIKSGALDIKNKSFISSVTGGKGNAGNIDLKVIGDINIDNSLITSSTDGRGDTGKLNIETKGNLFLGNQSTIGSIVSANGIGNSQGVNINVKDLYLDKSLIYADTFQTARVAGKGNAGDINIKATGDIKITGSTLLPTNPTDTDLSQISSSSSGQGDSGKITIDAKGRLSAINYSSIFATIDKTGVGNSKGIFITAGELELANQSYIETSTAQTARVDGKGTAGDINIKTTGDIKIVGANNFNVSQASQIRSSSYGQGNTGKITINTQGKLSLVNQGVVASSISPTGVGNGKGIKIDARELELKNQSSIISGILTNGKGNAGDIEIKTIGDIRIAGSNSPSIDLNKQMLSSISSSTSGQGNTGKIIIDTQGKLSLLNGGFISSQISQTGIGNSKGISISARELELTNGSIIGTDTFQRERVAGTGNAGDIKIETTGDIRIAGYDSSANSISSSISQISSSNIGAQGDTGEITINTQGKLFLFNAGSINSYTGSYIGQNGIGNNKGIAISARELELANGSSITTATSESTKGNAGDIKIGTTGDIKISGSSSPTNSPTVDNRSYIDSSTRGNGDTGKITINTQGKLSLINQGNISSTVSKIGVGNGKGIEISARELELTNGSIIGSGTFQSTPVNGKGNAGDIQIETTGDIKITGHDLSSNNSIVSSTSQITSSSIGQGDAGKITLNTQGKLSLINQGSISSSINKNAVGNSQGISISARDIELNNLSYVTTSTLQTTPVNGKGKAGDIDLKVKGAVSVNNNSYITTSSTGVGEAGNISISASQVLLNQEGAISSEADAVSGGNITIAISDRLLLRNHGFITTNSGSTQKNGNGGNITISSPLIIALPGDNDISANANGGKGGNINITSQGLFGIQYRPKGQNSPFTNDITASSDFGQSGNVNISTPGTDPGKDKGELTAAPNDASNQISQACSASQRDNKFYIIGRGGHPANAEDPLTSDVVWLDPRVAKQPPTANNASIQTTRKLASPAVGWVFDGKGKVTLIAAETDGVPTGTRVVCPKEGK